jgi:hypothetical protein
VTKTGRQYANHPLLKTLAKYGYAQQGRENLYTFGQVN